MLNSYKIFHIILCLGTHLIYSQDNPRKANASFWFGKVITTKKGKCNIEGSQQNTNKALFKIDFDNDKRLKILEYSYNPVDDTFYEVQEPVGWTGYITKNGDCDFSKTKVAYCNSSDPLISITDYIGTYKTANIPSLTFHAEEEWCPDMGCVFHIQYQIQKTDSVFTNLKKISKRETRRRIEDIHREIEERIMNSKEKLRSQNKNKLLILPARRKIEFPSKK